MRRPGTLVRVMIHAIRKPITSAITVAANETVSVLRRICGYWKSVAEIIEAVSGRRPRLRVADVERGLQQIEDRVEDQHRGNGGDPIPGDFLRGDRPRGCSGRAHSPSMPFHSFRKVALLLGVLVPIGRIEQLEVA